ncbi:hypothetical protein C1Y63_04915 [Corynebacterium sp. 13CS0277]|uniref:hypothetical protein n=1 Tax=Corynebacterium sp. 13CS0277 TaxID=2071994 RepID=UPI000D02A728|nr:hypothetical protein [Corynebacterium sp. 13CS0277]PRQ11753.1 hypothetical protein C1Y63_04915 [Corynebacterium sp. 13CS0277]
MSTHPQPTGVYTMPLSWTSPPLSMNHRMHHHQRAGLVREIRHEVATRARALRLPTRVPYAVVQLHYRPADNRRRDTDNLVATLKPICDALTPPTRTGAGWPLVDDDVPRLMAKPEPIIHTHAPGEKPSMWLVIATFAESLYTY